MMYSLSDYLYHGGTKGMKWGYTKGKPNGKRKAKGEEEGFSNARKPKRSTQTVKRGKTKRGPVEEIELKYPKISGEASVALSLSLINGDAPPYWNYVDDNDWISGWDGTPTTKMKKYNGYWTNSANCAFAFELRERGYDVVANPMEWQVTESAVELKGYDRLYSAKKVLTMGGLFNIETSKPPEIMEVTTYFDPVDYKSHDPVKMREEWHEACTKHLEEAMLSFGDGARGYMLLEGPRRGPDVLDMDNSVGKPVNWKVENGNVNVYDSQSGSVWDLTTLFHDLYWGGEFVRTDDCVITSDEFNAVRQRGEEYEWEEEE